MTTPHRTLLQQALDALRQCEFTSPPAQRPIVKDAIAALREALAADHLRDVAEKVGPAAPVPDGWVMVPKEATREMCVAAVVLNNGNAVYKNVAAEALEIEEQIYGEVWSAMIAASPAAPVLPLTDSELAKIAMEDEFLLYCDQDSFNEIARAIEAAHGITGGNHG